MIICVCEVCALGYEEITEKAEKPFFFFSYPLDVLFYSIQLFRASCLVSEVETLKMCFISQLGFSFLFFYNLFR